MRNLLFIFLLVPILSFGQTKFNTQFIEQKLVQNDSSIINNTDLKIYLLIDAKSTPPGYSYFKNPLEEGIQICGYNDLTIHAGGVVFTVKSTGLFAIQKDTICTGKIKSHCFETHRIVTDLKKGGVKISYDTTKRFYNTQIGKIEISPTSFGCDDTGQNPMRLTRNGKSIYFNDIGNLLFFEYDIDNDGKKELYILNYFSCAGHLEIYKIDTK